MTKKANYTYIILCFSILLPTCINLASTISSPFPINTSTRSISTTPPSYSRLSTCRICSPTFRKHFFITPSFISAPFISSSPKYQIPSSPTSKNMFIQSVVSSNNRFDMFLKTKGNKETSYPTTYFSSLRSSASPVDSSPSLPSTHTTCPLSTSLLSAEKIIQSIHFALNKFLNSKPTTSPPPFPSSRNSHNPRHLLAMLPGIYDTLDILIRLDIILYNYFICLYNYYTRY